MPIINPSMLIPFTNHTPKLIAGVLENLANQLQATDSFTVSLGTWMDQWEKLSGLTGAMYIIKPTLQF